MDNTVSSPEADGLIQSILNAKQESEGLEFKRIDGSKVVNKVLETVVAMANTDGGLVVIGVADPQKSRLSGHNRIFGIEENGDNFDSLTRELPEIKPHGVKGLSILRCRDSVSEKTIAVLSVPKSTTNFYSCGDRVLVRRGKSNHKLSHQEYMDMSYAKGFKKADQELVEGIDCDLLDTPWFQAWRANRGLKGSVREILIKTGLARKNKGGDTMPTRAAVLLFAELPDSLMAETKCSVRIFKYEGGRTKYGAEPNLMRGIITLEGPTADLIGENPRAGFESSSKGIKG